MSLPIESHLAPAGNLPQVVDAAGIQQIPPALGVDQKVQIEHLAVEADKKCVISAVARDLRIAHSFADRIDRKGHAV